MQCLTNIVGVTTSDCQCIINGLTPEEVAALKVSKSGLFLDDLEGGVHLKALANVDACRKMSQMANTAIANATKRTEDDLVVAMNNRYEKNKNTFMGQIGRMSYAQTLPVSRRWQFVRIRPIDVSDAVMILSKVTVIINEARTFNIRLFKVACNSVMGEQIAAWPVTTTANAYQSVILTTPLKIAFYENGQQYEYYFAYDRDEDGGTMQPKDTKIECATCPSSQQKIGLNEFVTIYGGEIDDINNLQNPNLDSFSHGLILDVAIKCDNEKLFCREYNEDDAIAVAMSYAVWFKAGELLIEDVLKQPDVNRYTTMAREYLWGKRNHFRTEYESRINYMSAVIDVTASNCYVCRETTNQPFYAPIMS